MRISDWSSDVCSSDLPALQPRGSYGADRTHHPFAALFAVGLPAALDVAVALSPMIVEDKPATVTTPWTSITLPKHKPPEPRPHPKPRTQTPPTPFNAPRHTRPPGVQEPPEPQPLPQCVPPAGHRPRAT